MWSLFDNLGAVVVIGAVTIVLFSVQLMAGDAQVDSTQRASGRTVVAQTADWIERDLANVGFDVPVGDPAILDYAWSAGGGTFRFVTLSDTSATARADTVRYVYSVAGGAPRLDRYVTANGTETQTASAGPSLARMSLELRTAAGGPVGTQTAQTARIDVVLEMRTLLDAGAPPVVWEQQIYPANLVRRTAG